jgi:hypothetical protein
VSSSTLYRRWYPRRSFVAAGPWYRESAPGRALGIFDRQAPVTVGNQGSFGPPASPRASCRLAKDGRIFDKDGPLEVRQGSSTMVACGSLAWGRVPPLIICLLGQILMRVVFDALQIGSSVTALVAEYWAVRNLDKIIEIEYQNYREQWVRDGKPYIWLSATSRPDYRSWMERRFSAQLRTRLLSIAWLYSTPSWMNGSPEAKRFLRRYRIGSCIAVGIIFSWWTIGIVTSLGA